MSELPLQLGQTTLYELRGVKRKPVRLSGTGLPECSDLRYLV